MQELKQTAERTLQRMQEAGFDAAQVSVSTSFKDELNVALDEPSLLRSTEGQHLQLLGIIDGRKADSALTDLSERGIADGIAELAERARFAPQDDANAVSAGETGHFEQGPATADLDALADSVRELLDYRAQHTPKTRIEEGAAEHSLVRECLLTSEGTDLSASIGSYSMSVMGTASEGDRSSSFNEAGGTCNDLRAAAAHELFGIGDMLADTQNQIDTVSLDDKFTGDVVFAPGAVRDLLGWLLGQLGDMALISDSSIYRERVGEQIASSLLTISSRFDGPGHAPYTGDGFVAPALTLVDEGQLTTLLPGLYGSRKTGITHRPAASGWQIAPGTTPKAALIGAVQRGALVNRLSMGSPAANGDFSGVIKNSFLIENGELGSALSETMIAGNMGSILNDVVAVSAEHLDTGGVDFPWIQVSGLNFS